MQTLTVLLAALGVAVCSAEASIGFLDEEKRAPGSGNSLGFSGMRGKKDDTVDGYDKRAGGNSLGFSGMRGKKDDDLGLLEDGDDALLDKRARNNLGFSGMRGKKDDFDDGDVGFLDKRARNQLGFSGMRGKKDGSVDELLDDGMAMSSEDGVGVFGKRARNNLGFSGMRGKKATTSASDEFVMEDLVDKRGGGSGRNSLGFSGMRGKKAALLYDVDAFLAKRARGSAGFVGMRGRRENNQAFFGMRGKRGEDEDSVFGYLQSPEAARDGVVTFRSKRYLPAHWQLRNSKKAPFSGFIGLRGKKNFQPAATSFRGGEEQQ